MSNNPRFRSVLDWQNYIQAARDDAQNLDGKALYDLRKECYRAIEEHRERPLIVYESKFPDTPRGAPVSIDQTDIDGFVDLVGAIKDSGKDKSVDVLINSPGGSPEATERIVNVLRTQFDEVHFLVPHSAFSAATMLALSGDTIVLHPAAVLGPIDPQINGIPARSISRGFERVRELLRTEGPKALPAYLPLLEKHSLETLEICDDSLSLSKELTTEWLQKYMFNGQNNVDDKIAQAVDFFSEYDAHKTHGRPLGCDAVKHLGLEIKTSEEPLTGLLREAHILIHGLFGITPIVKLFETATGMSWGRQYQMISGPLPIRPPAGS